MTGDATALCLVQLMTINTSIHRGHALDVGHGFHLGNVTVAHFAFHAGIQMLAVIP